MKVHKMSKEEIQLSRGFIAACEDLLERGQFDLCSPCDKWEDWDDDDEHKVRLLKIRKEIAQEESILESEVDNRILAYEHLRRMYYNRTSLAVMTADILIDNCCDPMADTLEFLPSLQEIHVAPEQ